MSSSTYLALTNQAKYQELGTNKTYPIVLKKKKECIKGVALVRLLAFCLHLQGLEDTIKKYHCVGSQFLPE